MAVYKVPQDVEADDKLIGPFSFRQFIYLIVVAISMAGAWGLGQLFPVLAILPLPIIILFSALALPLRKDQPMEAYLSAVVSFYFLKSHKRFWQPDGIDSFVTIIPPKDSDKILVKQFDENEATKRLDYLAELVDTRGWAIRGVTSRDSSISNDLFYESQQAKDVMDENSPAAQAMTERLQSVAESKKEEAARNMKSAAAAAQAQAPEPQHDSTPPATTKSQPSDAPAPAATSDVESAVPSPEELRKREQEAIKRAEEQKARDAIAYAKALAEEASENRGKTASVSTPETDTMVLTKQQAKALSDQEGVTIATIAHQAKRVASQNRTLKEGEEVTISLH